MCLTWHLMPSLFILLLTIAMKVILGDKLEWGRKFVLFMETGIEEYMEDNSTSSDEKKNNDNNYDNLGAGHFGIM